MKRGSSTTTTEEAMQLLVDPMCNFFAGLVFLSVLVALLAKNQPPSPWRDGEAGRTFANEELLTARLAEVREATEELSRRNREAAEALGAGPSLPSLSAVEKALAETLSAASGGESSKEVRAGLEGALSRERDRLRGRHETLGNEIVALKEESVRLEGRLGLLGKKSEGKEEAGREVRVRLPLARSSTQAPLYIMVSGGKFYPLQGPDGREDETHVVRERSVAADEIKPRAGRGLAPGEEMDEFLRRIDSRHQYPVLVVYADSFEAYQGVRAQLESRQQSFGWEPRPTGSPLRLSAQGFKPEVQ